MPDDRVAAAIAELYGSAPEAFTGRRAELAAAARGAGDRVAARAIGALRRPTRAAWVVNRLARMDPSAPCKLAELAAALRAAQQARHGPRLRELSAARGALVDALTVQALATANLPDPPPSLRLEVTETLTAALADPEVATAFAAGTLTRAAQWSGFGLLPAAADEADSAQAPVGSLTAGSLRSLPSGGRPPAARTTDRPPAEPPAAAPQLAARQAGRQPGEEDQWLAREAAEHAARRQERYAAAEREVAAASSAAAEAGSAEDQLEAEVRDLEQRLTRARADLAAARMRARRAESAERRARQALGRLPRQ